MRFTTSNNILYLVRATPLIRYLYKKNKMINWINGFDAGNKKEKYYLECRLGTFTVLELKWSERELRVMVLNLGFEIYY
tara:strand:+ start:2216 stop:2452 length:237 start_codon:yes stop_codon:yes gene_type:complete